MITLGKYIKEECYLHELKPPYNTFNINGYSLRSTITLEELRDLKFVQHIPEFDFTLDAWEPMHCDPCDIKFDFDFNIRSY